MKSPEDRFQIQYKWSL